MSVRCLNILSSTCVSDEMNEVDNLVLEGKRDFTNLGPEDELSITVSGSLPPVVLKLLYNYGLLWGEIHP